MNSESSKSQSSDYSNFDMYEYYRSHIREDGTLNFDSEEDEQLSEGASILEKNIV